MSREIPDTEERLTPCAVLLDIDGTLIDSNDAHARAWVDAFQKFDFDVSFEQVRPLIGMGGDKLVRKLVDLDSKKGRGKELADHRGEIFKERYAPTLKSFPQSRDLLERMRDAGLTLVIATSAKQEELKLMLRTTGLEGVVDDQSTSSDASRSKPDPDIVLAALDKSNCAPGSALMLGDTPYDLQAAQAAGVRTVAFRSGGWKDDELRGALALYDDPADLLAHFDESPFARTIDAPSF